MNPSRIEQTIEEIYAFIEECKSSKLYPNKVVVAKDELYDLLDALRLCAPEEIKRYQKIINNRDHILGEAQRNAEQMVSQAKQQTAVLLDESDMVQAARSQADAIMKEAEDMARNIIDEANQDSEQIRNAALYYTSDLLSDAEKSIQTALSDADVKYRMLTSALESNLETIRNNKSELVADENNAALEEAVATAENSEEEFQMDEDSFIKDVE